MCDAHPITPSNIYSIRTKNKLTQIEMTKLKKNNQDLSKGKFSF
jgi:hypothetical protein